MGLDHSGRMARGTDQARRKGRAFQHSATAKPQLPEIFTHVPGILPPLSHRSSLL